MRDSYKCTYCDRRTSMLPTYCQRIAPSCSHCRRDSRNCLLLWIAPCKGCSQAFARSHMLIGELLCAKCEGRIKDWREDNSNVAIRVKLKSSRLRSFVPVRENINAKYFVDGANAYRMIARAILAAKHELLMCFWMLCPVLKYGGLPLSSPHTHTHTLSLCVCLPQQRSGCAYILWLCRYLTVVCDANRPRATNTKSIRCCFSKHDKES
jgi:hypothetical protein